MCGIAGTICLNNTKLKDTYVLEKMMRKISDRGPDGHNIKVIEEERIGLVHTRLAIIDLSENANQPMCDNDGTVYIVFNGEIYNHQEIRQELNAQKKIIWKTDHSDTEVIIEAYKYWGINCILKFVGMFAFALWDSKRKIMYLVRDRLGIKPLYYSIMPNKINFASNIKALLEDPEQERKCDKKALYDFISLLAVPAPNTLFENIKKLSAGTYMEIRIEGTVKTKTYWDAIQYVAGEKREEDYYQKLILKYMENSVELRKESDVPIGIFLSGGVDSTTNLALFSKNNNEVKTFTVGYKDVKAYKNENAHARQVAKHYNADFFEVLLGEKDVLDFLPTFSEILDDPVADPVMIAQYFIARLAKENGIKVIQVGEGADELFGGYEYWEKISKLEKINMMIPAVFVKIFCKIIEKNGKLSRIDDEIMKRCSNGKAVFWGSRIYVNEQDKRKIFSSSFLKELGTHETWDNFSKSYRECMKRSRDPLLWMTYVTTKFRLPDLLLARSDKACMSVGVEARVPFLDHRLVEQCMSIPGKYKIKNHTAKYILKKGVGKLIPTSVIERKKVGFGLPFFEWYRHDMGEVIKREIESFSKQCGYFDEVELRKYISKKEQEPFVIWAFYVLALWWKAYI